MSLISCRNLAAGYGGIDAVKGVSFDLGEGDCLVVVGRNGSGKSSLMKAVLSLLPLRAGLVSMHGVTRAEIGYLPQQCVAQGDFPASVNEVVLSGCLSRLGIRPFYSKKDKAMAEEKMDLLGITAIRKKSFQDLSGGQRQRVLLARALCSARKVLFMDEPVNGLDPGMTEELYALIKKLNRDEGLAMMMTSHDVERAAECATTILHVDVEPLFMGSPSVYMNEKLFCSESPGAKQCLV